MGDLLNRIKGNIVERRERLRNNKINSMRKMIEMIKEQYNAMVAVRLGIFKYESKYAG